MSKLIYLSSIADGVRILRE